MERRRGYGVVGLIAVILLIAGLISLELRQIQSTPTTAFAPADTSAGTEAASSGAGEAKPADEMAATPTEEAKPADEMAAAPAEEVKPADQMAKADETTTPADQTKPDEQTAMAAPESGTAAEPVVPPKPESAVEPAPEPGMPTFDVVRVEPSGDTVVAGQAAPKATVEILDGAKTIATSKADDTGAWAMPLDKPLDPGAHDLAIRTITEDQTVTTLSDQRVTVSVPEKGSKDVLVVLNSPDKASKVLEASQTPAEGKGEEVAMAPPAEEPAASAPEPAPETAAATPDTTTTTEPAAPAETATPAETAAAPPEGTASAPTTEAPAVAAETPAPSAAQPPAEDQQTAMAAPDKSATDQQTGADQQTAMAEPPVAAEPPVKAEEPATKEAAIPAEPPVAAEPPIAAEPPVKAEEPPPPPTPEVTVTAVEADTGGQLYVAGVAKTGESVRVYLDGQALGDAKPSPSGTWLLEIPKTLQAGKYTVRADQVDSSGSVIARSEVPFERELEVAILKPAGEAQSQPGVEVSGDMPQMQTVIIKRGDNLWRIARATWGRGIRWSTIYQANTDQIRNPHWIYPGQVFIVPKGDTKFGDATAVEN